MDKLSTQELLMNLFYDIDNGFIPADKLLKQAKQYKSDITMQDCKDFVSKQPSKEKKAYRGHNSYISEKPLEEIELDIADMNHIKNKGNKRYMLVGIDIFSKYGHAVPMSSKSSAETAAALKEILDQMGIPQTIYTDCGSEFLGETAKVMKEHKIVHQTTIAHANFAERFIRTLKNKINDRVEFSGNKDWMRFVPIVLKQYNNTEHRTTKLKPIDAQKNENHSVVKENLVIHAKHTRVYEDLAVGDYVRILKKKDKYGKMKEHVSNWSETRHKITDIPVHHDVTYFKVDNYPKLLLRHEIKLTASPF